MGKPHLYTSPTYIYIHVADNQWLRNASQTARKTQMSLTWDQRCHWCKGEWSWRKKQLSISITVHETESSRINNIEAITGWTYYNCYTVRRLTCTNFLCRPITKRNIVIDRCAKSCQKVFRLNLYFRHITMCRSGLQWTCPYMSLHVQTCLLFMPFMVSVSQNVLQRVDLTIMEGVRIKYCDIFRKYGYRNLKIDENSICRCIYQEVVSIWVAPSF